jgi:nucleoid-associated protein EbfC
MFNSLGNLASLLRNAPEMLRQAQQMQGKMAELQEKLSRLRVEAQAGGGMVSVTANGQQKLVAVKIDPSLCTADDRELLEDLLKSAVNQALEKAKEAASEEVSRLMGDVGSMPGLSDMLAKVGLGPGGPFGGGMDPSPSGTSPGSTTPGNTTPGNPGPGQTDGSGA